MSFPGTVTLVPQSGAIVGSDYLLSNEGWTIVGNPLPSYDATYEPYSRGALMNHYILGTEGNVNVQSAGGVDQSLWYFNAPTAYHGNHGIAYGGTLQFTLASFSGDFSSLNGNNVRIIGVSHLSWNELIGCSHATFSFVLFLLQMTGECGNSGVRRL